MNSENNMYCIIDLKLAQLINPNETTTDYSTIKPNPTRRQSDSDQSE